MKISKRGKEIFMMEHTKKELAKLCDKLIPGVLSYHASQIFLKTEGMTYRYKDKSPSDEDQFVLVLTFDQMKALQKKLEADLVKV
jgi:hypothetical protein